MHWDWVGTFMLFCFCYFLLEYYYDNVVKIIFIYLPNWLVWRKYV